MISSSSDGRVRRAIASDIVDLGIIPSPVKPKTQKLVLAFTKISIHSCLYLMLSIKSTILVILVMTILKTQNLENFEQVLVSVSVFTFQEKTILVKVWVFKNLTK